MNKFVNIAKFSMLTAVTAGLTIGTVVESAEALSPGSGWTWGSVTNAGNDPDDINTNLNDDQNLGQNIGFDLLLGKERISSDDGSFIFKGAIENFFYTDLCQNELRNPCNSIDDGIDDDKQFNEFKLGFDVGDLRATLNNDKDKKKATYEILSNNFFLETNKGNTNINIGEPDPFVVASFELTANGDNSFVEDLDTIVGEFYNQFFILESGKDGNSPEDFVQENGKNKINNNDNAPKIQIFPPKGLPIQFQGVDYTINPQSAPTGEDGVEGDDGTFVIKEIAAKKPVKTVPEPGNIVSLLALGTLGAGALHRRKIRINSNK